jgi:multidrug efflux pump subunit AcrB
MWITRVSINHPVFATMVMVGLTVLGLFSYARLGVEPMPDVSPPGVMVWINYPGASPEQVENDLAKPVENAANTVAGVKRILSRSDEGRSLTWIEFRYEVDMTRAMQEVRDKLAQIRAAFPRDAKDPVVERAAGENDQPVASFALLGKGVTQRELTLLAEQVVQKGFERVNGVGRVQLGGTVTRQVQVRVDPAKLNAVGLAVDQVVQALRTANVSVPVGTIYNDTAESIVRVDGRLGSPAEFGRIVVARKAGVPILLSQVATVSDAEREPMSLSRVDGQLAVGVSVYKAQDANMVEVGRQLKQAAEDIRKQLPPGAELKFMWAMADFVEQSVTNVKRTIIEGALLTVLIVFLFLGSWRSTVITGLTLPISVIASFTAVYALGFTLNYMTLMALSLCIGLLIDDAIVVRENIVRHIRMGKDHYAAAREGTDEIGLAVLATTLSIVAVFVPIAFMSGIVGKFFYPFGITVVVAVLLSLFVSFTLDPMLSAVWRDPPEGALGLPVVGPVLRAFERLVERLHAIYDGLLRTALAYRKSTLAIAVASLAASLPIAGLVGTEMVPQADQSYTTLRLTLPVGSSLEYASERVRRVEQALREFPEIAAVDTAIGTDGARNTANVNLKLTPRADRSRSQKEIEQAIRKRVASVPGVELKVGWDTPIYVALLGNNDAEMNRVIADFKGKVQQIRGVTDVEISVKEGTPALSVRLKPELAAEFGITHAQLGTTLRALVGGENSGYWLRPTARTTRSSRSCRRRAGP